MPDQKGEAGAGGWAKTSPEVTAVVSHDVGMAASFQHENLLLEGGHIVICEESRREEWL